MHYVAKYDTGVAFVLQTITYHNKVYKCETINFSNSTLIAALV